MSQFRKVCRPSGHAFGRRLVQTRCLYPDELVECSSCGRRRPKATSFAGRLALPAPAARPVHLCTRHHRSPDIRRFSDISRFQGAAVGSGGHPPRQALPLLDRKSSSKPPFRIVTTGAKKKPPRGRLWALLMCASPSTSPCGPLRRLEPARWSFDRSGENQPLGLVRSGAACQSTTRPVHRQEESQVDQLDRFGLVPGTGQPSGTPTIPRSRCERSAACRPAGLCRRASPPRRPHLRRRLALRRA